MCSYTQPSQSCIHSSLFTNMHKHTCEHAYLYPYPPPPHSLIGHMLSYQSFLIEKSLKDHLMILFLLDQGNHQYHHHLKATVTLNKLLNKYV